MSEINNNTFNIDESKVIGMPKGDDRDPAIQAFEDATGIEVPRPTDRKLTLISQGRKFMYLKGKDIPGFAGAELIDLGMAGTDSVDCYLSRPNVPPIQTQAIGDAMCQLVLMCESDKQTAVQARLEAGSKEAPMPVVSPLPAYVNEFAANRGLPIRAVDLSAGLTVSGSIEIMPELLENMGVELVVDRVASGETARANGLVELMPLADIYPALVQRAV